MRGISDDQKRSNLAVLVCFAVKEEAKFFAAPTSGDGRLAITITGMGRANAEAGLRKAIAEARPGMVITAGFAGGLNPELTTGQVVFQAEPETGLIERLSRAGGIAGRFHCAERVAVSAAEKAALWESTGADAVEMESGVIRALCREQQIPSATVRVISDAANEDLPLDFNALMTPDQRIDYGRLAWKVATSPRKIPVLMRFQKRTAAAAKTLAEVLRGALSVGTP